MKRLPLAFFSTGALCVMGGMIWGMYMGSKQDFTLAPAHAHLNLVGWATLALMGTFYQLSGKGGRLGWINYLLSTAGVVVMIPALALLLGGKPQYEGVVIGGSILAALGMLTFLVVVLSCWRDAKA
ncbi:MAG TPA: hypothetical protein VHW05_09345 [Phenylobacterium sp.]|jgi:hypothetical protein|nr:hypothetical protein [Phenylobacterium sp.]